MWSHYAKNHTGVCFEFDTKQMIRYFAERSKLNDDSKGLFLEVNYGSKRINYMFESSKDPFPLIMWIKTKSIDWEYEKEIRLVFLKREDNLLSIPSFLISKIYLGNQISPTDEDKIIRLCKTNFPETKIVKMQLSDTDFKLVEHPYK